MNTAATPQINQDTIDAYRRDGYVRVPGILSTDEAEDFRRAALAASRRVKKMDYAGDVFDQCVNVWTQDETIRRLTLNPHVGSIAQQLAGVKLRLWHDQLLIKQPNNSKPTEFHQDQPYWPHADSHHAISCWIALSDVPVERGCMTFIPGYQHREDLAPQDLMSSTSLFEVAPEMQWAQRVTWPLRAGDCTFHHGRTPHMATPNFTDESRVAHVAIFIDAATNFTGGEHVVTDPLGLNAGQPLPDEHFPRVGD